MITFAEPLEWKNSRVLKVSGTTARTGVFTSGQGLTAPFTPELVERIFSNTDSPIPSYLTHDNRDKCGWMYKLGYDKEKDEIVYEGFVFDKFSAGKIENEGFDKVSPELDFDLQAGVPVDGRITGIAFVRNPAISGTQVTKQAVAFSKAPKDNEDGNMVETKSFALTSTTDGGYMFTPSVTTGTIGGGAVTVPNTYGNVFTYGVPKEEVDKIKATFEAKIAELEQKLAKFEEAVTKDNSPAPQAVPIIPASTTVAAVGTNPAPVVEKQPQVDYKQKYDMVLAEKAQGMVNELRELGFKDPEAIGKGLDAEARITVLSAVKENIAKTTPMTRTSPEVITPTVSPAMSREEQVKKLMADNGINDSYLKYVKVK